MELFTRLWGWFRAFHLLTPGKAWPSGGLCPGFELWHGATCLGGVSPVCLLYLFVGKKTFFIAQFIGMHRHNIPVVYLFAVQWDGRNLLTIPNPWKVAPHAKID